MEQFLSPNSGRDLRSDPHQSQIIGGDADEDHTQIIGGDTVKLLGGNIPPSLPYFGTPAQTSISPPNYIVCFQFFNFKLLLNSQRTIVVIKVSCYKINNAVKIAYAIQNKQNEISKSIYSSNTSLSNSNIYSKN